MSTPVWEAMARAAATRTWPVGMCDNFCANMYGFTASGYTDATAHWNSLTAAQKHAGDADIPAGMLAFWSGGHGHVAISDGLGGIWSTDIGGAGTVSRVPLSRVASLWGKPYLGWGEPVFQGVDWSGDMARVMRDSTNPSDIPVAGTDLVAGYLNGSYAWGSSDWARFPAAGHVTIDVNGSRPDADVLDVEPGDATVAGGVVWLKKALAVQRDYVPVIYCNRSNRTAFVTAAKAAGYSVNTHFKFWVATLDGTRTLSDMNGVAAIQWAGTGQTGHHYDQSDVFDAAWKAGADVPITDAEVNKIAAATVKLLLAGGGALENSDLDRIYTTTWTKDAILTPDTAPDKATNPTYAAQNVLRGAYDNANHAAASAAAGLAQSRANGASLTEIKTAVAGIQTALAAVDLSHLPADIAAKLEALKLSVTVTGV